MEEAFRLALSNSDSVVWDRSYANCNPRSKMKVDEKLELVLKMVGAKRLVIGHTVQDDLTITSDFGDKLWKIDVGMSLHVASGPASVLQIDGDKVSFVSESNSSSDWMLKRFRV